MSVVMTVGVLVCKEQTIFHVILTVQFDLYLPNIEERMLEAGDIVFIPAGAEHRFLHPEAVWKPQSIAP
jgi:ribosomal protein L16 Arg81 hydroxylase